LKQLLAAIGTNYLPQLQKSNGFEPQSSASHCILEPSIAEKGRKFKPKSDETLSHSRTNKNQSNTNNRRLAYADLMR